MRAVIQRVREAYVKVEDELVARIGKGLVVLVGVEKDDSEKDADYLCEKICNLRIFEDDKGKFNFSLKDIGGELLVVSQFTLLADCRKGRRPSFERAEEPKKAETLYEYFIERAKKEGIKVLCGRFQKMMDVSIVNYGPVTIVLDTKRLTF